MAVHQKYSSCGSSSISKTLYSRGFSLLFLLPQELVLGLLLGLSRSIPSAHETMRRGEWAKKDFTGRTLTGKTLGIIGFGSVGRAVRVLNGFYVVEPQPISHAYTFDATRPRNALALVDIGGSILPKPPLFSTVVKVVLVDSAGGCKY